MIRKAVIPIAGRCTRILPLSAAMPKALAGPADAAALAAFRAG